MTEKPKKQRPKPPAGRRWVPGQSGNPTGRPKVVAEVRDLAREYTAEAMATLAKIMRSNDAPPSARVAAATQILDRGYGRPSQEIIATNRKSIDDFSDAELAAIIGAAESEIGVGETPEGAGDPSSVH